MARLKRLPEQGIELDLTIYRELRFNHGTTSFLEPENQGVIRNGEMKKFLARATVERLNHIVRYDYMVNGKELLSTSRSILEAPTTQEMIRHIQNATADLKRLSEDDAAPTTRMMIEQFRLPSPKTEPELYRVVTIPGEGQRIIVLWGCESDAGPGVMLGDVTNKLTPISQIRALLYKYWPLLVMLLLALFMTFLISSCKETNDPPPKANPDEPIKPNPKDPKTPSPIPAEPDPEKPGPEPRRPIDPQDNGETAPQIENDNQNPSPINPKGPVSEQPKAVPVNIEPVEPEPKPDDPLKAKEPENKPFALKIEFVKLADKQVELRAFSKNDPDAPFEVTYWKLNGQILIDLGSNMPLKNSAITCFLPEGDSEIEVAVESKGVPKTYKGQINKTSVENITIKNQSP